MTARYYVGDVLDVLRTLPDGSVDVCMTSSPYWSKRSYLDDDAPEKPQEIGQETSPSEFLDAVLAVADEMARVLSPWGSMWWNLGDTAIGSGGAGGDYNGGGLRDGQPRFRGTSCRSPADAPEDKSVAWVPSLFGASLAYGRNLLDGAPHITWVTRPPITWCKENPSVGELIDAVRVATELVVFAARQGRYFFDLDAVREPREYPARRFGTAAYKGHPQFREGQTRPDQACNPLGAPPLDWWVIPTAGYRDAHYAVMPAELLRIPMLASVPERVCTECSEPWERRVVCHGCGAAGGNSYRRTFRRKCSCPKDVRRPWERTTEWERPCGHDDWRPGRVVDPFAGTGTTGVVANGHGRDAVLIDLDKRNADLALARLGMFLDVHYA